MKKGWQTKTLGDLFDITSSKRVFESDWKREGVPFYRAREIVKLAKQGYVDNELFISEEMFEAYSTKYGIPTPGDIMVTGVGTLGICYVVKEGDRFYFKDGNIIWLKMRSDADSQFVEYAFQSDYLREQIDDSVGATVGTFTIIKAKSTRIPVPPLAEQQRIVGLLDEAFEGLATAKANAEKNLQNARALFESHLQSVFTQRGETGQEQAKSPKQSTRQGPAAGDDAEMARLNAGYVTRTGGREATLRHIPGNLSLAVGMPSTGTRKGWRWSALNDLARLESGHTPSRRHPEYWGGSVPWIGIQDARENHGQRISDTFQKTNELGIANSSARVLPENTVCLSRTASVGYVVVMARPMATSQDFVNWVCSDKLQPDFLKYLILAEGREGLLRYASGSVHQTIYFPEAKAFHICYPEPKEQLRIVRQCDGMREETQRLARLYERKHAALAALKKSLLHQAFTGEL